MAINVYGWRKPTLELELVEGGTLAANTTYYVIGFMRYTPQTYNSVGSPLSDLYTITTTSTARSIKITQKTYRDITAFASGGTNITTVTSTIHCLKTGDVIKIATGSYAGTWTITKVDANTFTIPTAYVDNVAVQCYTDSVYYNKPSAGIVYMMYYVDTLDPYDANGTFLRRSRWLERVHQFTYGSQNPVVVTAQPTGAGTDGTMNLKHSLFDNGVYKEVCDDYGLIYIEVIDDVVSLLNIHTAVQNSGFIQNTHLTSISNVQEFTLIGSMTFSNTAALTLNSATLNYICSEVFHRHNAALLTYTGCLIKLMPVSFTAQMLSTMNNCVFYNRGTSNNYQWIFGDDTIFYALPRPSYNTNSCDIPNHKYNNLETGGQDNYGIIQNKIYRDTGQGQIFQTSYNHCKFINCTAPSFYWLSLYGTGCRPDIYMMENCKINRGTYYTWHYRLYTDSAGSYYNHHFKYLNINVDSADNNIKKCIHNYVVQEGAYLQVDFYRRLKLYISNQSGEAIENATINITDNADNIYTGITDASGYTYIDCLEQKTRFDGYDGSSTNWNPTYDTYYSGFTITIDKEGYEQEVIKLDKLYQEGYYDTILNVSLHGASYPKSRIVNATA